MKDSGTHRTPNVELVYDKECPNADAARANLRAAFERLGIRGRWTEREASSPATSEALRGFGSPTVLVNGRDVAGLEAANGASCRLYETSDSRRSHAPPPALIEKALMAAGMPEGRAPKAWAPGLLITPGVLVAFLPALACAACWPAYAALLSSLGVGLLANAQVLLPVTIAALAVALTALAWGSRQERRPLLIGAIGAVLVLVGKFSLQSNPVNFIGAGLLVAASLWSMWLRRGSPAECPSCVTETASFDLNAAGENGIRR